MKVVGSHGWWLNLNLPKSSSHSASGDVYINTSSIGHSLIGGGADTSFQCINAMHFYYPFTFWVATYCWCFRTPKQPPGIFKTLKHNGINYQPQSGFLAGFLPTVWQTNKNTSSSHWSARPDRYGPSVIGKYTKGAAWFHAGKTAQKPANPWEPTLPSFLGAIYKHDGMKKVSIIIYNYLQLF